MEFSWIPLEAAKKIKSLRNNFIHCVNLITKACKLSESVMTGVIMICGRDYDDEVLPELFIKTVGLYILHDKTEIYAMALITCHQLEAIYVPENYRKKGYASALLRNLYNLYKSLGSYNIKCPVRNEITNLFLKVGWIKCSDKINKDDTYDYTPDYQVKLYDQPLHETTSITELKRFMINHLILNIRGVEFMSSKISIN